MQTGLRVNKNSEYLYFEFYNLEMAYYRGNIKQIFVSVETKKKCFGFKSKLYW